MPLNGGIWGSRVIPGIPMAKRGPKPKQTGVPRTVRWSNLKPPEHLTEDAQVEYVRLAKMLKEAGTLERTDPRLVELYAINVALIRKAQDEVNRDGLTLKTKRGAILPHPALAVINSATLRVKAIVNDLGLCPSSSKHGGSIGDAGGKGSSGSGVGDPWEGLLNVVG